MSAIYFYVKLWTKWWRQHQNQLNNTGSPSRQPNRSQRNTKQLYSFQSWKSRNCKASETHRSVENVHDGRTKGSKHMELCNMYSNCNYNCAWCIVIYKENESLSYRYICSSAKTPHFPWSLPKAYDKQRPSKGSGSHGAAGWLASVRTGWPGGGYI